VNFDGERRLDTAALYTALGHPAELLTTGIRVTPAELFDGLALWLALHEPDSGRLFTVDAAADLGLLPLLLRGMTSTYVLLEEQAMAALVCLDQEADSGTSSSAFELGVRVFGAGGYDLAQRLVGTIHQWHASGRRATVGLRVRAYPAPATPTATPRPSSTSITAGSCSTGQSSRVASPDRWAVWTSPSGDPAAQGCRAAR
jgi:protein-L-isoaspartate(D-aspartate) O-methyltransferase